MINMPASPGNSPWQVVGADNDERNKWGDTLQVPVILTDFTDLDDPANPFHANHTNYLSNIDPRSNHGKANPRNPLSPNYILYNPAMGRREYL